MNRILEEIFATRVPQFNKNVTNGSVKEIIDRLPEYFNNIIESAVKTLNPGIPFKYLGYRIMTPYDEYNYIDQKTANSKINYDIAENYIYMAEYMFEYNGEKFTKPLYMPYLEDGNIFKMSDTSYHIIPVLSDTVISPSSKFVFVRLLKDKLTFNSSTRNILLNRDTHMVNIIHTKIMKVDQMSGVTDNIGNPLLPISLYLVTKYGIKKTFLTYMGIKDYIITEDVLPEEIYQNYNVFESVKIKPKNIKKMDWIPHDVKICVHKKYNITPLIENFIAGLICALDTLPDTATNIVNSINSNNLKNEITMWKVLLGRIIYKDSFSLDRILPDMDNHMINLDGYIDDYINAKIKILDVNVKNFFDLISVMLDKFMEWLRTSKEYNSNIKNRYIDVVYYVIYDLIIGFNKILLDINKKFIKGEVMSSKELNKLWQTNLSYKKIYSMTKTSQPALCVSPVDNSLDIKYPKITSILED